MMEISIIVITKNNIKTIKKCLNSLINLNYNKEEYEILFIDGHSSDGTDEYIKNFTGERIKLIYEEGGSMGYARNVGIKEAKGEYIFFIDGDAYAEENWLKKIMVLFSNNPKIIAIGGLDILIGGSETRSQLDSWRRLEKSYGLKAVTRLKTVNFAIRKDILLTCGMFNETLSHFDERELVARLYSKDHSFEFIFDPDIIVYHERLASTRTDAQTGIKKIFKKTEISIPILLKPYMIEVALKDLSSPLGISFLLLLLGASLPFTLILLFFMRNYIELIIISKIIATLLLTTSYIVIVWIKTRKFNPKLFIILLIDIVVRSIASFYGFYKTMFTSFK